MAERVSLTKEMRESLSVATFAGGCFWCVESGFEQLPGVYEAVSGYSGGDDETPSYRRAAAGGTAHTEAFQVYYDPKIISYSSLLQGLWRMMDTTDSGGQFADRGSQYRPAIFYHNADQKKRAEAARDKLTADGRYKKPVTVEIVPFTRFYDAEGRHQDYYRKNPIRYNFYTSNSGRYQFVDEVWGEERHVDFTRFKDDETKVGDKMSMTKQYTKPGKAAIKGMLTPLQYHVAQ